MRDREGERKVKEKMDNKMERRVKMKRGQEDEKDGRKY